MKSSTTGQEKGDLSIQVGNINKQLILTNRFILYVNEFFG
jgi:hypothetical protein